MFSRYYIADISYLLITSCLPKRETPSKIFSHFFNAIFTRVRACVCRVQHLYISLFVERTFSLSLSYFPYAAGLSYWDHPSARARARTSLGSMYIYIGGLLYTASASSFGRRSARIIIFQPRRNPIYPSPRLYRAAVLIYIYIYGSTIPVDLLYPLAAFRSFLSLT